MKNALYTVLMTSALVSTFRNFGKNICLINEVKELNDKLEEIETRVYDTASNARKANQKGFCNSVMLQGYLNSIS